MADLLGPGAAAALNAVTTRPSFVPVNQGASDPDTWARDCSSPSAADGTQDKAAHMNMLLAQLRSSIRSNSIYEDSADDFMLARAMRAQRLNYISTVGGTANALTATLDPAPASYSDLTGTPFRIKIALTNTGAATLNLNGLGAVAIGRSDNSAVAAGDLLAGRTVELMFDGGSFQIIGLSPSSVGLLPSSVGLLPSSVGLLPSSEGRLINTQVFTSSGTYTPTSGMTFCIMEGVGGGGAGGGATTPPAGNVSLGAPGTAGTWGKARFTASVIGASKVVTIGAGGAGVPGLSGANGGDTSVAGILQLPGGRGGPAFNNGFPPTANGNGAISSAATGANIAARSGTAPYPSIGLSEAVGVGASGGDSPLGAGGFTISVNTNGIAATGNGAGGSGTCLTAYGWGVGTGGAGSPGILIITEYGV